MKCDSDSKIITDFSVTDASVHDSQCFLELVDEKDEDVKADSGYVGEKYTCEILEKFPNMKLHICARAYRESPLSTKAKESNKKISHICARVQHIFGYMTRFMGGISSRSQN
ncbi:MAG: transposase [Christensenellaceae bacterium]|nr:transposase [Christensenellaceae bacterium]